MFIKQTLRVMKQPREANQIKSFISSSSSNLLPTNFTTLAHVQKMDMIDQVRNRLLHGRSDRFSFDVTNTHNDLSGFRPLSAFIRGQKKLGVFWSLKITGLLNLSS